MYKISFLELGGQLKLWKYSLEKEFLALSFLFLYQCNQDTRNDIENKNWQTLQSTYLLLSRSPKHLVNIQSFCISASAFTVQSDLSLCINFNIQTTSKQIFSPITTVLQCLTLIITYQLKNDLISVTSTQIQVCRSVLGLGFRRLKNIKHGLPFRKSQT